MDMSFFKTQTFFLNQFRQQILIKIIRLEGVDSPGLSAWLPASLYPENTKASYAEL